MSGEAPDHAQLQDTRGQGLAVQHPPVFGIYVVKLVLDWLKGKGGLAGIEKVNEQKKNVIYSSSTIRRTTTRARCRRTRARGPT